MAVSLQDTSGASPPVGAPPIWGWPGWALACSEEGWHLAECPCDVTPSWRPRPLSRRRWPRPAGVAHTWTVGGRLCKPRPQLCCSVTKVTGALCLCRAGPGQCCWSCKACIKGLAWPQAADSGISMVLTAAGLRSPRGPAWSASGFVGLLGAEGSGCREIWRPARLHQLWRDPL